MGLTGQSTGLRLSSNESFEVKENERLIALAGNPNVGKSTVFNNLTGLKQHTGNWTGKTVSNAFGRCKCDGENYVIADLPGTYSLAAHSEEERVARDFICFGGADAVVTVCDATCLERNLNLVIQTLEITRSAVVCLNLIDEAGRKGVKINAAKLSSLLGVPVVETDARKGRGVCDILRKLNSIDNQTSFTVNYPYPLNDAIDTLASNLNGFGLPSRWLALRLLENDTDFIEKLQAFCGTTFDSVEIKTALESARSILLSNGINGDALSDLIIRGLLDTADKIFSECIISKGNQYSGLTRRLDRIMTGKVSGTLVMLAALMFILWLTISGANYPSELLSRGLFAVGDVLRRAFNAVGMPDWAESMIVDGVWRTLAWVTSVMLPPMAIFFPLFTLLEDMGFLPRIAFNLDGFFKRCDACGKQALTMCMGFGCNAAGVVGCRIIDSEREKLIAILTNCFVPCNGRFPMMIMLITVFFASAAGFIGSFVSAAMLTGIIVFGIIMTFLVSKLLSVTVLKGKRSAFTLELPPYRMPRVGSVIVRSMLDRTLFVLGRAVAVAAPAGLLIWIMANVTVSGNSLLSICASALDPFGRIFGMDGVILVSFILGMPANEIVVPIIAMAYMSGGSLSGITDLTMLHELFTANGWTPVTALCVITFSLMHWPCTTTLLTVKKETHSLKWTVLSFLLPTVCGLMCCFLIATVSHLFV